MQSCASAAKLRGGGPILNLRREGHSPCRVAATSVRHLQMSVEVTLDLQQLNGIYSAGRSRRPAGVSPVVTSRHSVMRSLRASATIIVLRLPPRESDVRLQNHAVSELPF